MSVTVVALNRVNDYHTWREAYDSKADFRQAAGIVWESVHHATDDPNSVPLTHGFATADQAQAFLVGPSLQAAMDEAGVVGPPRIEIYQDA